MTSDPTTVRQLVFYHGDVQGVGFRYTARRVASEFAVSGFVRNLPDGRVELVVEGRSSEVRKFLRGVRTAMEGKIRHTDVHELPATGEFSDFEVRY